MKNLSLLIKPASSMCNLRCKYCFYADEACNRSKANLGIMNTDTIKNLISEVFDYIDEGGNVTFAFQGGEPIIAGLGYYQEFIKTVNKLNNKQINISYSIQTNGTLINEEWAQFFKTNNFLVGISIDGYKEIHNKYRVDSNKQATYNKIIYNLELLKKYSVDINALCVVTKEIAENPKKAYNNLKDLGFKYMQFIGCLDPIGKKRGSMKYSLTPDLYGNFLSTIFDLYYDDWSKGNYHSIRLFDDYIHGILKDNMSTCATCGKCGGYFVIEADGSVYPCDFYCLDKYKIGNINENGLAEIISSNSFKLFLSENIKKPDECFKCKYKTLCNGGCKNDWENNHNYYCKSFKKFFEHSIQKMINIAQVELKTKK